MRTYVRFIEELAEYGFCEDDEELSYLIERLDSYNADYIPYECLKTAIKFSNLSQEEIQKRVDILCEKYGDISYTKLLNAQYYMYLGENDKAENLLIELYRNIDSKNYIFTYQLAMCFKKLNRFYESYLLIKHLTWIAPDNYMVELVNEIYEAFSEEYNRKLTDNEIISDMEHITMARLCQRTYTEHKKAIKILERVSNPEKYVWEYNITKAFCYFENFEESKADENLEMLKAYDKSQCTQLDLLEYEEANARQLYVKNKNQDCVSYCNKILAEYPLSYPILMLRSYADSDMREYEYLDLSELNNVMGERPEAALLLAAINAYYSDWDYAIKLVKPYKNICQIQLRYYEAKKNRSGHFNTYIEEMVSICEYIRDNEVGIYDKTLRKYILSIYDISNDTMTDLVRYRYYQYSRANECFEILETLKDSQYNCPARYLYLNRLYCYGRKFNKIDYDISNIDFNKIYEEDFYYEGEQFFMNFNYSHQYDKEKEMLDLIDIDRVSIENGRWVNSRMKEHYRFVGDNENALKWIWMEIERLRKKGQLYFDDYFDLFKFYAEYIEDKQELEKAVEIFNDCVALYGKYGDMNSYDSVYEEMVKIYLKLGRVKEAKQAAKDMKKYTKSGDIKRRYYWVLYLIYDILEDYKKAYEYVLKYEKENPEDDRFSTKADALWKIGEYSQVADMFMGLDNEEDKDYMVVALHSRFFENMELDMDFVQEIYDTIFNLMEVEEKARIGFNYLAIAEMCMHLGKDEEYEKYMKLGKEFEWDEEYAKEKILYKIELWSYLGKGEFKNAYDYILTLNQDMVDNHYEFSSIKYILKQMDKKGKL